MKSIHTDLKTIKNYIFRKVIDEHEWYAPKMLSNEPDGRRIEFNVDWSDISVDCIIEDDYGFNKMNSDFIIRASLQVLLEK